MPYHTPFMPCHTIPYYAMPYHTPTMPYPYHAMSYHTDSMPCNSIPLLCNYIPLSMLSCHAMQLYSYHAMLYHTPTMPCHTIPCHAIPYHTPTMPCHAIQCHAIPYLYHTQSYPTLQTWQAFLLKGNFITLGDQFQFNSTSNQRILS